MAVQCIGRAIALDPGLANEITADKDFAPLLSDESFQQIIHSAHRPAQTTSGD
jgi:hypothetical protein